jgi:hypothetical protein
VDAPLLESLDTSTLVGLRDRALIGVLVVGASACRPTRALLTPAYCYLVVKARLATA